MARVVAAEYVTVDGVMTDPGGVGEIENVDRVTEISLELIGEPEDVFDGERVVAVVIQRPYMRQLCPLTGRQ